VEIVVLDGHEDGRVQIQRVVMADRRGGQKRRRGDPPESAPHIGSSDNRRARRGSVVELSSDLG
jgi:hypothetical protein